MAMPRGAVLFLFLLLVAAELATIDAMARMGVVKQTMIMQKVKEKHKKEKEEEEKEQSNEKEEGPGPCFSKSHQLKGFCFDDEKCKEACLKESFSGGECRREAAMRKCFCKKPC